jgi:anti-anti-sigma factor
VLEDRLVDRRGDLVVIGLRGQLEVGPTADRFVHLLREHYALDNVSEIRIDLESVDFLDSVGLGKLLLVRQECAERNKRLVVIGATGQVKEKLQVAGVLDALESGR